MRRRLMAMAMATALALTLASPALGYTFTRGPAVPEPQETGIMFCVLAWLHGTPC